MNLAAALLLAAIPLTAGTVVALETEQGAEALMRAVSFSPWGAAIVWVFLTIRRAVNVGLERLDARWAETIQVMREWADAVADSTRAMREGRGLPPPPVLPPSAHPRRAPRPRTNPTNG